MRSKLLHEAQGREEEIARKYNVPTYGERKEWGREHVRPLVHKWLYGKGPAPPLISEVQNWSAVQKLAFTLVYYIHCCGSPQRAIIINREFALRLLEEEGEIPKEIEGVPIVFNENALVSTASLP